MAHKEDSVGVAANMPLDELPEEVREVRLKLRGE